MGQYFLKCSTSILECTITAATESSKFLSEDNERCSISSNNFSTTMASPSRDRIGQTEETPNDFFLIASCLRLITSQGMLRTRNIFPVNSKRDVAREST